MKLNSLTCKRCGYSWYPRIINGESQIPGTCARCRSPYWFKPVERKSVSEARKK